MLPGARTSERARAGMLLNPSVTDPRPDVKDKIKKYSFFKINRSVGGFSIVGKYTVFFPLW